MIFFVFRLNILIKWTWRGASVAAVVGKGHVLFDGPDIWPVPAKHLRIIFDSSAQKKMFQYFEALYVQKIFVFDFMDVGS